MAEWICEKDKSAGRLVIEGDLTVQVVSDLKEQISAAFKDVSEVTVDISAIAEVDVAGLQLLIAGQRLAEEKGWTMHLMTGANQPFRDLAERAGFTPLFASVPSDCQQT